jgi:hypothetical protein
MLLVLVFRYVDPQIAFYKVNSNKKYILHLF